MSEDLREEWACRLAGGLLGHCVFEKGKSDERIYRRHQIHRYSVAIN